MLRRALALTCLLTVLGVTASAVAQDDLVAKRDKKLAAEWLKKAEWFTDYDKARAKAAETNKLVFGYFTRSYSP
ncbi:MAG: hypothetical protein AAF581_16660 [Planctomycetota bacterium]